MNNSAPQLVLKLWNYCSILRNDGLSYGHHVEKLTFLLFLKMAGEQAKPPYLSEAKRRDAASSALESERA
jgi:type I restriction enzyme M protein